MAFLFGALLPGDAQIPRLAGKPTPGDAMLADYFRNQTTALSQHCLADINTLDEWKAKRGGYRRQLQEMLGSVADAGADGFEARRYGMHHER